MQKNALNLLTLIVAVIALPVTLLALQQQERFFQQAQVGAEVLLVPNTKEAQVGQLLAVAVDVNTGSDALNSVQLDLRYPADKLDLTDVDTNNSAFDSQTEYVAGNGLIRMGREATSPVEGQRHIATVKFEAKDTITPQELAQISGDASFNTLNHRSIYANTTFVANPNDTVATESTKFNFFENVVLFFKSLWPFK